jgi:peptidoglycan/xylan/chitin deacetylase (PgdA/CDA1 family)
VNRRSLLRTTTQLVAAAGIAYVSDPVAPDGALAREVISGPADRPAVALTFHGQGDPVLAGAVLDLLLSKKTQVTVLAVGTWLAEQPDVARRILGDGHELGNHTQHHLAIADLPTAAAHAEIAECAAALTALTGSIGPWFRPSQIQHATTAIRRQAAIVGYPACLSYDVDSLDYTDPGPAAIVRNVLDAAHPGAIVSLHLGHPGTVTALSAVIDGLRRAGLAPVTATALVTA